MNEEEAREFAKREDFYGSLTATRGEGTIGGRYQLYMVATMNEFPATVQCDSWSEDEVKEEIQISYFVMSKYFNDKHGIVFPKLLGIDSIRYIDEAEFINRSR